MLVRVIVFFGHHKVGSSSIQDHLGRHAPQLAARGILYPAVRDIDADRLLQHVSDGRAVQSNPLIVREAHNALAFAMIADENGGQRPVFCQGLAPTHDMFATIRRQVQALMPHTLILVSEVFANFSMINPAMVLQLLTGVGATPTDKVQAIGLFRRIDEYLVSWHGQRIRFGHKVPPVAALLDHYLGGIHFDYRRLIEPWAEVADELRLLRYQKGKSLTQFLTAAGLRHAIPNGREPKCNPSLHPAFVEIARRAQYDLPPDDAQRCVRVLRGASALIPGFCANKIEFWGPQARERLFREFQPQARYLDQQTRQTFFPDLDQIGICRPIPQRQATKWAMRVLRPMSGLMREKVMADFLRSFEFETNS
jgi:hypothetical protein